MPKSWFFEIHEDTPEEEAANLMEHSASVLDISSDDDSETKRRKQESELGKENVPPPDWCAPISRRSQAAPASTAHKGIHSTIKVAEKAAKASQGETMQEDREALAALDREDFFPEGLDEKSVAVVEASAEQRSSSLGKESAFDLVAPTVAEQLSKDVADEEEVLVRPDSAVEEVV